ncbi:MAG TPA: zinc ribbon domain-containing protein [Steroidobacteraceae bacterium]|jgi:putative FmdB family regulatory protein
MPFYEYECANCKYYTEIMQKLSDAPLRKCPSCGKNTLKKLVSAPVFRLKGAGWYETDFKSDKEGKRNLAEKEKEPPAEKKEEAKGTEAKAADKAADAKAPEAKASETKSAEKSAGETKDSSVSRRNVHRRGSAAKAPATKSRPKSRSAPRKHR